MSIDPRAEAEVQATVRRTADVLADAGHPVSEVELPRLDEIATRFGCLVTTELAVQRDALRTLGSAGLDAFFDAVTEVFPPLDLPASSSV